MDTAYDSEPFTSAELEQLLSGRATPNSLLERRHATKQRDAAQIREFHTMQANPDLAAVIDRITTLEAKNEDLIRRVSMLEAQSATQPRLDGGKLPPKSDITQLWVQVFHSPNLTAKERKTKGEWSLRLTVWVANMRVKREINVRLYPADQFYRQAMNRPQLPDTTHVWASALQYEVDVLAGMLVATTQGKGRPFIDSQFCVLAGHLVDTPHIDLIIGDDTISLAHLIHRTIRPRCRNV